MTDTTQTIPSDPDAMRREEGALVECTELANDAGFQCNSYITERVFDEVVKCNDELEENSSDGTTSRFDRLRNVWLTARLEVKRQRVTTDRMQFQVGDTTRELRGGLDMAFIPYLCVFTPDELQ